MTTEQWLDLAQKKLYTAGVETARLDALVLLEDVIGLDRAHLLAHPDTNISTAQMTQLQKLLSLRATHAPLAYVRGKTEFYGRSFLITPAVLEPRPESETMIDMLKALVADGSVTKVGPGPLMIADVGTGSGALGITAALEVQNSQVELLDIDKNAAQVAKLNVDKFTLNARVLLGDLLAAANQEYDFLLCNLPYVPDHHRINQAASHEPKLAIFGGLDGLDLYRKLFTQIGKRSKRPLFLLLESFPSQHRGLQRYARSVGYKLLKTDGFIQAYKRK